MKHPMNYRLALLFGLIATGIEASDAAEWTSTIDRHATFTNTTFIGGELATTDEALWIGPNRAFDPTTGADLSPYALPERMSLVDMQYGISSQRGQLWKTYQFFDDLTYYQPDAVAGFWGTSGTAATTLVHLAEDGAQKRKWTAADLGHPGMPIRVVRPLLSESGALVMLRNESAAVVLKIDDRGRIIKESRLAGCSDDVADDRHGGVYALCWSDVVAGEFRGGELHHVDLSTSAHWSRPIGTRRLFQSGITTDGGILIEDRTDLGDRALLAVDRSGNQGLSVIADVDFVAAVDDGFWLYERSSARLTHRSRDGLILASVTAAYLIDLVAHPNGAALARIGAYANLPETMLRLISPNGTILREVRVGQSTTTTKSLISIGQDTRVPLQRNGQGVVLIDDSGEQSSASIPFDFKLGTYLMADARTVCISRADSPVLFALITYIECFNRSSGLPLMGTGLYGQGELLWVGDYIVLRGNDIQVRTREGEVVRRISLQHAIASDFHPTQGFAVLRSSPESGNAAHLERYRSDGSLIFDVAAPFVAGESVVAVGSDGSTLVAGKYSPTSLLRYDAEGNLRAMRTLDLSQPGTPLIAASSSSNGVLLLQRRSDDRSAYSGQVTMLDAQLVRRGDYAFAGALDAKFQPARDGAARFVHTTPSGMMVLQFDPASGQPSERRALPVQNIDGRFAIDLDGVVRAMSFDAALGRDVLRISRPEPSRFTGPIRQSALAGAWFNPASTGQGLLLQLLNGDVLFGAWHTFAPEGGNALSKQQWFTVTCKVTNERGRITMPIYRNAQGRFDTDGVTPAEVVGSAELVFTGCDQMEFWYRIGDDAGAFPLQRLTPRTQACDDGTTTQPAADAPKGLAIDGAWLDPAQSGQGFTFNTTGARFGSFLAGWFTYDTDNGVDDAAAQHWFTLQGATPERYGQSVPVFIHRTTGGSRAGTPTLNSHQVGSALLTIDDCAHATLDYAFDDSAVAGPFADRARRVQLSRLGACPQ